jgi:3-hydroxybutyryl-CoA dehydratase
LKPSGFDNHEVGQTFETAGRTVTEAHLVMFTGLTGIRLPIFIDEAFSREHSRFKTRVIPGPLTIGVAVGLMDDIFGADTIAALGMDAFRFLAPVFPGDTLSARITVKAKRTTANGEQGILTTHTAVRNDKGTTVLEFEATQLMRRTQP